MVWGLEHFRLYVHGKPIKKLTDYQALEPIIECNRSNKTNSARLTRWLYRLAHFTINISHIAGKHLALTDYLSHNPSAPPQAYDAYDEEYVIHNIFPNYIFVTNIGCLSNHFNQSQRRTQNKTPRKANIEPKQSKTRERSAIDCLKNVQISRSNYIATENKFTMDARTIDNLEQADPSAERRHLVARWRDIVKPGIYRLSGGRWKKYQQPKFLRNERRLIEEKFQQAIKTRKTEDDKNKRGGFSRKVYGRSVLECGQAASTGKSGRQTKVFNNESPATQQQPTPMEEGEIDSESDHDPSVLEVPAVNWAKMGQALGTTTEEPKDWDLGKAVRESEKNFSTVLQLLMTKTTNDPTLLKTLVSLERQQQDNSPEEYQASRKYYQPNTASCSTKTV